MKFSIALATVLLALVGFAFSLDANAQTNCSGTYDAVKKYCVPLQPEEWEWYWRYGSNSTHGPFESQSAALADLVQFTLGPTGSGQSWCEMTLDHFDYDATPSLPYGIPGEYNHGAYFYVLKFKNDPLPCQQDYTHYFSIKQSRKIGC